MRYGDKKQTVIVRDDGAAVPCDPDNADYAAIVASGAAIEPYTSASPTAVDVDNETQRRIIERTGAKDLADCFAKQLNAQMRAIKLTRMSMAAELTPEQSAEAASLEALAADIERLRSRGKGLKQAVPIPSDYASDHHWL